MGLQATEWNAVVIGAWNVAILTPDGICKRLFGLPENTPVDIQVALDKPGYFRVAHNGVVVTPNRGVLDIAAESPSNEALAAACEVAVRAISDLPETPFLAAGINLRYQNDDLPEELLALIEVGLDNAFSDAGYEIGSRSIARTLRMNPGVINVELRLDAATAGKIVLNFHLDSTDKDALITWLNRVGEFCQTGNQLLAALNLNPEVAEI